MTQTSDYDAFAEAGDADLRVADLAEPLPYADDTFDDVVASLVSHYLQDWGSALTELRRVLKPGGRLLASVNHPPLPAAQQVDPAVYRALTTSPSFLCLVLEASA
jgi:SAM-dependent methyltransferase